MKKCIVEGCGREVKYPRLDLCHACYQGLYYWSRQGVARAVKHKKKLHMLSNRMDVATPNVHVLSTRRRKKG